MSTEKTLRGLFDYHANDLDLVEASTVAVTKAFGELENLDGSPNEPSFQWLELRSNGSAIDDGQSFNFKSNRIGEERDTRVRVKENLDPDKFSLFHRQAGIAKGRVFVTTILYSNDTNLDLSTAINRMDEHERLSNLYKSKSTDVTNGKAPNYDFRAFAKKNGLEFQETAALTVEPTIPS